MVVPSEYAHRRDRTRDPGRAVPSPSLKEALPESGYSEPCALRCYVCWLTYPYKAHHAITPGESLQSMCIVSLFYTCFVLRRVPGSHRQSNRIRPDHDDISSRPIPQYPGGLSHAFLSPASCHRPRPVLKGRIIRDGPITTSYHAIFCASSKSRAYVHYL